MPCLIIAWWYEELRHHGIDLINIYHMMISLHNIFRVSDPLRGESTGHRWIPLTKGQLWGDLMISLMYAEQTLNKQCSYR